MSDYNGMRHAQTAPKETLLVKSKTRGKVILHPTFEGKETAMMPLVKCTPMTWKFHCRNLTNRVKGSFTLGRN